MKPTRAIVCATDFSESSDAAVRVAHDYARQFGVPLHLLHVTWPAGDPRAAEALGRLAAELGRDVRVLTATEVGMPAAPVIVRYAQRHGADLVVLGTHGRTGVTRALIGSVAERVVRTAPCPVLTVRREPAVSAAAGAEATVAVPEARRCLVCARPSEDLVCEPCRAHIRGEEIERRRREERAGR